MALRTESGWSRGNSERLQRDGGWERRCFDWERRVTSRSHTEASSNESASSSAPGDGLLKRPNERPAATACWRLFTLSASYWCRPEIGVRDADVGVRGVARPLCPALGVDAPSATASPSAWFGVEGADRERLEAPNADEESFCLNFENALNAARVCFFGESDSRTPVGGAFCGCATGA